MMNRYSCILMLILGWMLLLPKLGFAQTDYFMSNMTARACKGNFFDSDLGLITGDYGHNENFIFKICTKGAASITLTFTTFCTETDEDYIIIYDGKDTTANKLSGRISGSSNPGSFTGTDSCMTIFFHSDGSVPCTGWEGYWTTDVEPFLDPIFLSAPNPSCDQSSFGIRLDTKFNCDSISAASLTVAGPVSPNVTSINAVGCDANNETDTFTYTLDRGLDRSGQYFIHFEGIKYDVCDSAWLLEADTTFSITDCPIYVELDADPDTICLGSCTDITAIVQGGDSLNYNFQWSSGITGTFGPHTFCPTASTWVRLTVTDGISIQGSDSIWIEVVTPPTLMNDTSVCISSSPFNLLANPTGGLWSGRGISNTNSNLYRPALAGQGVDSVVYNYNGCLDTMLVTVEIVDAGIPNASCPGDSSFFLFGASPAGGVWSGSYVRSDGLFNPIDSGSHTVTYSWKGCSDTKQVNVFQISVPDFDTVCRSVFSQQLSFYPVGGVWTGPGFADTTSGIFYPGMASNGDNMLIYRTNGCSDTMWMFVKYIDARPNQVTCPETDTFRVYQGLPAGGIWKGAGIIDTLTGLYDPSFIYALNRTAYNDFLTYTVNGCSATKIVYIRSTVVGVDTLKFCITDPNMVLNYGTTLRSPGGGRWTGNGIIGTSTFRPSLAGYGSHVLTYTANTCFDTLVAWVEPPFDLQADTSMCISDDPLILRNNSGNGSWSGAGITNSSLGVFDPTLADTGSHVLTYTSAIGCKGYVTIGVKGLPIVRITALDKIFCAKDSLFLLTASPVGGRFYGNGVDSLGINPEALGTGLHKVYYIFGTPTCFSIDSATIQVLPPISGSLDYVKDTLCGNEQ
ncbi:MAG: hypothetical protein ACI8ZN_002558, partial [Bacteroidia bacterium]